MSDQVNIQVDELPVNIKEDAVYEINQTNPNSYTHNFFKYPCKFIPEIPRWAIRAYYKQDVDGMILDPFSGSGTTLLEASLAGARSLGAEIDEIAKLITKVKTTKLSYEEIYEVNIFTKRVANILEEQKYSVDDVIYPEINNLEHWFRKDILNDLGFLYHSIILKKNTNVKNFLLVCMASIIKRVSNADDISPKPYVSNNVIKNPPDVATTFSELVKKYITGIEEISNCELAAINIQGDATHISALNNTIDLAVTSPPYINAFDYVRTLRLENLWLQMSTENELREKKKRYLGTESISVKKERLDLSILDKSELLKEYFNRIILVDEKRALILKRFFEDMELNLQEVYRVLKDNSNYVIVIGNSSIRKVQVESWRVLRDIAEQVGFKYVTHFGYAIKNPYIRIPRGSKGGKIAIDHVLVIRK